MIYDLLNEDCSDISDWVNDDRINSVSTQVSFDGKSCFKFDTNLYASGNYAKREYTVIGGLPDNYTIEMNLYFDSIASTGSNYMSLHIYNGVMSLGFRINLGGILLFDGSNFNEIGDNLIQEGVWQLWRFEVISGSGADATCDIYLDNILQASNVDCSHPVDHSDGVVTIKLFGFSVDDNIMYLDYIKIGTGTSTHELIDITNEFNLSKLEIVDIPNKFNISKLVTEDIPNKFNTAIEVIGGKVYTSDASIYDEDMSDISDWTITDGGAGITSQVTFDDKSCMKLDSGISTPTRAKCHQDFGSFDSRTSISLNIYFESIGLYSNGDGFEIVTSDGTTSLFMLFNSDGFRVFDGSSWILIDSSVTQDIWQLWSFDIDWVAQTMNVYINNILEYANVDISFNQSGTDGRVIFTLDINNPQRIVYIDWFKIGKDFNTSDIINEFRMSIEEIKDISNKFYSRKLETVNIANKYYTKKLEEIDINNKSNTAILADLFNINNKINITLSQLPNVSNKFYFKKKPTYNISNNFRMMKRWQIQGA